MILKANQLFDALKEALQTAANDEGLLQKTQILNPWFTPQNSKRALLAWVYAIENAETWIQKENITTEISATNKKVGIIMAGNLPLVGLHDLLCVWLSGHIAVVKMSSQDNVLMKAVIEKTIQSVPQMHHQLVFTEDFLKDAAAYIGTGSNNTSRYFEYYFRNKPHIIRKNRNSIALLEEENTAEELAALGHDVFDYFGMGCRNVTQLFVPEGFDFAKLFESWQAFEGIIHHHKYANNYTYHKAILLMNLDKHLDNGFVILAERDAIHSPVSMLNYSFYKDKKQVLDFISNNESQIQCVVSSKGNEFDYAVPFGKSQEPQLWDYADGINTHQFLKNL